MAHHFLVGGGTGFLGKALCHYLKAQGCEVTIISRMPGPKHISWQHIDHHGLPKGVTAVVNLAGQNVLDPTRRWTPGFKQNVYTSRVNTTKFLAKCIQNSENPPKVFIGIAGVSIYPAGTDDPLTEESKLESKPNDFMSKLCADWEKAMELPKDSKTRQVTIRTGVVLGRNGGMIQQTILPFWFGLGGPLGNGNQLMPWIHIDDLVSLFWFSANQESLNGPVNGVAPQIITNKQFTEAFGRALFRPAVIPIPEFIVNLMFSKERAVLLLKGPKVLPVKAMNLGFEYKYPNINVACKSVAHLFN